MVLFFSDGLTEARNRAGEFFPVGEIVNESLRLYPHGNLNARMQTVIDRLRVFVDGDLRDDLVVIAVQLTITGSENLEGLEGPKGLSLT